MPLAAEFQLSSFLITRNCNRGLLHLKREATSDSHSFRMNSLFINVAIHDDHDPDAVASQNCAS